MDKVKIRLYLISVFAITVFELFYYGIRFNPTVSRDNFYPVVDPIKFLQSNLNYERVAAIGDIFIPQVNMLYGIQDIRSCDPMRIASFDRWQQKVLDRDVGWGTLIRLKHINTTVLDWLNIKYLITSQNNSTVDTNILTLVYQKNGICIYENKRRFPRAFIVSYSDITVLDYPDKPNEKNIVLKNYSFNNSTNPIVHSMVFENVQIEHYGANKVVMNTQSSQAGYLFLSDTYYPGWTAKIDNHSVSIHRAMDAFRAIEIPAGEHRVVFEYKPLSFTIGWITSLLTFVLLAVLYIFFSPKKLSSLIDNKKI